MYSKPKHIILVDDDEDDREFFHEAIEEIDKDVKIDSVTNGFEALEFLNSRSTIPDAIFLDLNMPILDGPECLRRLRSTDKYKDLKVIMYSTSYNLEIANKLQQDGANFYICKPNSFSKLKELIEKALTVLDLGTSQTANHTNFFIT